MEVKGRDEASNIDRDVASFVTTPKGQGDAEHGGELRVTMSLMHLRVKAESL